MNKTEGSKGIKKNKKMIVIAAVLGLCLIAAGFFVLTADSAERKLENQLELGQKYLDELDYEQAIVAYKAAIEIDPKCEEAYLALAEIYVEMGDYESAVDILNQGIEQTGAKELSTYLYEFEESGDETAESGEETDEMQGEDPGDEHTQSGGPWEQVIRYENGGYLVKEYDASGNCIKRTWYNASGNIDSVREYDVNENCMKRICYNADGNIEYYYVYEYDMNGNCMKGTCYNMDGSIEYYNVYEYDVNGNLNAEVLCYNADGSFRIYEYYYIPEHDVNRNRIKETYYNADRSINRVYEYDVNGNCTKTTYYNADGIIAEAEEY